MGQNNNFDANQRIKSLQDTADFHTIRFASKGFLGRTIREDNSVPSVGIRAAIRAGAIPDANGKLRCPPGTPNANQFTDVQLSNCGKPSARTALSSGMQMAQQLGGDDIGLQSDIVAIEQIIDDLGLYAEPEIMAKAVEKVQQMTLEERQLASLSLGGKKQLERENRRIRNTKDFPTDLSKTPRERMSDKVVEIASQGKDFFRASSFDDSSSPKTQVSSEELIAEQTIRALGDDVLDAASTRLAILQEFLFNLYGLEDEQDRKAAINKKFTDNKTKNIEEITARHPLFDRTKHLVFTGRMKTKPDISIAELTIPTTAQDGSGERVNHYFKIALNMNPDYLADDTGDIPAFEYVGSSDGATHPPEEVLESVALYTQQTLINNNERRQAEPDRSDPEFESAKKEFARGKRKIFVQALRDAGIMMGPDSPEQADSIIEIRRQTGFGAILDGRTVFGRTITAEPNPMKSDSVEYQRIMKTLTPVMETMPRYFWDGLEEQGIKLRINIGHQSRKSRSSAQFVNDDGDYFIEINMNPDTDQQTTSDFLWDNFEDIFGHELFHGYQDVEPREDELSYRHVASRTVLRVDPEADPKRLSALLPSANYDDDEYAYEDDFDNMYQGKIYQSSTYKDQAYGAYVESGEDQLASSLQIASEASPRGVMTKELGAVAHQNIFGSTESAGDLDSARHFLGSLVALSRISPTLGPQKEEQIKREEVFTEERPRVNVSSPGEALQVIDDNEIAVVETPQEAHTLLGELSKMAKEAKASGGKAPDYDLCQVSVPGTNLFCGESKGIPRKQMPQFSGSPSPGSPAESMPKNSKGEVDGTKAFVEHMEGLGVKIEEKTVLASTLKASQNELVGEKVAGMMDNPDFDPAGEAIFVSRDGFVIDGHHRWAAQVGRDLEDGAVGDLPLNVRVVDMDILEVLEVANKFAQELGIAPKAAGGPK